MLRFLWICLLFAVYSWINIRVCSIFCITQATRNTPLLYNSLNSPILATRIDTDCSIQQMATLIYCLVCGSDAFIFLNISLDLTLHFIFLFFVLLLFMSTTGCCQDMDICSFFTIPTYRAERMPLIRERMSPSQPNLTTIWGQAELNLNLMKSLWVGLKLEQGMT